MGTHGISDPGMVGIAPLDIGLVDERESSGRPTPPASPGAPRGMAVDGMGALSGKRLAIGTGSMRAEAREQASSGQRALENVGRVLAGVVLAPIALGAAIGIGLPTLVVHKTLGKLAAEHHDTQVSPRIDRKFRFDNVNVLGKLEKIEPDTLASRGDVMEKVIAHAAGQNNEISAEDLRRYVATGEKLAVALLARGSGKADPADADVNVGAGAGASGSPVSVTIDGSPVEVRSSLYTARALSWYVMAKAAEQDIAQSRLRADVPSNMTASGTFVMKDPGNAVFDFLSAAPSAGDRISTHFNERVDHGRRDRLLGFFGMDKAIQRGIEDYGRLMPGKRGCLLFDKLVGRNGDKEIFIKFESAGCPALFRFDGDVGAKNEKNIEQKVSGFFSAAERTLSHAINFSKKHKAPTAQTVERQEFVNKGPFKHLIAKPFVALASAAGRAGIIRESKKEITSSVENFGLAFVLGALDHIASNAARGSATQPLARQASELRRVVTDEMARLGIYSDIHGIERRAAEVHLSLAPMRAS